MSANIRLMGASFVLLSATIGMALAQNLTGIYMVTPQDIAVLSASNNITAKEEQTGPFQVYHPDFLSIIGSEPSLQLIYSADFPAFHEGGVVTSLDPLTVYASSNQFEVPTATPATNNKTIIISQVTQNTTNDQWDLEVVQNDSEPLFLANGGFQYQNGILFTAQGTNTSPTSAGLVYLPTTPAPTNATRAIVILNNYLGTPLNSPNDIYITRNGVIYFTDPPIGYFQGIRPYPLLPAQVYGFVPNTTSIRVVANMVGIPNGIQFSADEKTAYVTDTTVPSFNTSELPGTVAIYAFDVTYPGSRHDRSYEPAHGEIASFSNRRLFAQPGQGIADGIKVDSRGNVWAGCGDGINVWNPAGELLGKILVSGGTANFGFASDGKVFALNEDKLWLAQLSADVQPAVPVGQYRG